MIIISFNNFVDYFKHLRLQPRPQLHLHRLQYPRRQLNRHRQQQQIIVILNFSITL